MRVDLRWPADQQLLLGPMPFYVFREEIKEAITAIIGPGQILHLYVQNVPISGQIWGQVCFVNKSVWLQVEKIGVKIQTFKVPMSNY